MQERPHELPAHVLQTELEVRVLVDRVMAGGEGQRPDGVALPGGDLVRRDHPRRVTGAGGGDGPVVGTGEGVSQRDDGRPGADAFGHEAR